MFIVQILPYNWNSYFIVHQKDNLFKKSFIYYLNKENTLNIFIMKLGSFLSIYIIFCGIIFSPPSKNKPNFNWDAINYDSISRYSWRFPIKYCVDFPHYEDNVTKAINEFKSNTCISFKKVKKCQNLTEGIAFKIKVLYQFGCSYDGTTKDKKIHKVYITESCTKNSVLLIKLIFQALGIVYHEYHNNRDSYVTLHNETAVIFKYPYFPDESIDYRVLNVSYDYGSIMHSPSKIGFEKNFRFLSETNFIAMTFVKKIQLPVRMMVILIQEIVLVVFVQMDL
uniref:Astacin domain-containing protein n=1 Tax=Parastrongyloides trichosuri TaxID=131310 RepID=A0A0N4ZZX7_PARTI